MRYKLRLAALVSSIWLTGAQAHEVLPAIADIEVTEGQVELVLDLNLEAYLSGIDLDGLQDTDEAGESSVYNDLRALEPDDLAARVPGLVEAWNAVPLLSVDGSSVALNLQAAEIGPLGNIEIPRPSRLILVGAVQGQSFEVTWPKGAGELVLRQQGVDAPFTGYIAGGDRSGPIAVAGGDARTGWQAFASYIPVGFDHIVPKGLDHILFVLGLFFLSVRLGPLLWQVSAFTLAHTLTLALGALGLVNIPGSIVEPLIAASIVYVAVENIFARGLTKWRPAIIFGFGLLHGLGFASVLGEFGLPEGQFIPALIGFNVGVEVGQLAVIAAAAVLLWLGAACARIANLPALEDMVGEYVVMHRAFSMTGSLLIAGIAVFWVIERTLM